MASKTRVFLRNRKGALEYQILGKEENALVLRDPHTGKRFKLLNAEKVMETCDYKMVKRKA